MQQQIDTLRSDHNKSHGEQVNSLQQQLDQLRQQYDQNRSQSNAQASEWDRQRKQLELELSTARSGAQNAGQAEQELAKLRNENKQLETWLAASEEKAKRAAVAGGGGSNEALSDLERRLEMAMSDVRELKGKNAELSDQLAKAKASGGGAAADSGAMDWEAQKRRMLEQLDSDGAEETEDQKKERLLMQEVLKKTDQAVAEKEQEIGELRRLLENQSKNVGEVAVGASAIAQALDSDEIIQQERENLKQMHAKLREELKKAEVDCSLERAKIAREKAELEERLRQWESERAANGGVEPGVGGHDKGKKGAGRGKWLARLGLGDKEG
jgi:hypothetical protein